MKAGTGKEWDPENQHGVIWEDPDEGGDIEPLNSVEVSLPVESAIQSLFEANNPALPEETEMAFPKEDTLSSPKVNSPTSPLGF